MCNIAAIALWWVCSHLVSAKPVGNLALCMFQQYYAELYMAISVELHQTAHEMFSKELIVEEMMRRVVEMLGLFLDKAGVLVQAIYNQIEAENSSKGLMSFCQMLRRHTVAGTIATRMKARLSE